MRNGQGTAENAYIGLFAKRARRYGDVITQARISIDTGGLGVANRPELRRLEQVAKWPQIWILYGPL